MKTKNHKNNADLFCCFSAFLEQTYKLPPLAAKLQAYMVLESNDDGFTFEELLEIFNVSKSSLSNSLNFLLSINHVEYINKINSRKRYFRLNLNYLIEKLDFLHEVVSQEILFTNKIRDYKVCNDTFSKNHDERLIDIYLEHLDKTKKTLNETINKINKNQLENN